MYAVNTSRGAGKRAGFRAIRPEWPLESGETFTINEPLPPEDWVLAEDLVSFRAKNQTELDHDDGMQTLAETDAKMPRQLEDLIDTLITKGTIVLADLPQAVQDTHTQRKAARAKL